MGKKKVRIRWGRLLIAGAALLCLLAVPILTWLMRSGLDQELLSQALSEASGTEVNFESYSLNWAGEAKLNGLEVRLDEHELLTAKQLSADFSWWSLLRRQPEVEDLLVKDPTLKLSEPILDAMRQRPESEGQSLALRFENASVVYTDRGRDIELSRLSGLYTEGRVEVVQESGFSGTVSWDGKKHNYDLQDVPFQLLEQLADCELPPGKAHLNFVQTGQDFEGTVDSESLFLNGQVKVSLQVQEPKVKGTLASDSLTIAGYQVDSAQVPFRWDGEAFHLLGATLETEKSGKLKVDGMVSQKTADLSVSKEKLTVRLKGKEPPFRLQALWDGTDLVTGELTPEPWTLKVKNINGGYLFRLNDVDAVGFDFDGQLVWEEGLTGELRCTGGKLHGQKVGATSLVLQYGEGQSKVVGSSVVAKQPLSFVAEHGAEAWNISATGNKIPGRLFTEEMAGTVDLSLKTTYPGGVGRFQFAFTGDKRWPAVNGTGVLKGQVATFEALEFPKFSPPVLAQGSFGLQNGSLDFKAQLKGQELTKLWPASPVDGKLLGEARLQGTKAQPQPRFQGELRETIWQGHKFGTVAISATDQSMKATLSGFPLQSVPQLKPHLSGEGTLNLEGLPPQLRVTADFPEVKLKGQDVGQLKSALSLKSGAVTVESLQLGPASLKGTIVDGKLNLEGDISKLALDQLPLGVQVKGAAGGKLTIKGSTDAPQASFQGKVSQLVYDGYDLGDLPLEATLSSGQVRASVSGLKVEELPPVAEAFPELSGVLNIGVAMAEQPIIEARLAKGQLGKKALPPLSARVLMAKDKVDIREFRLGEKQPMIFKGKFTPKTGKFQLNSQLDRVALGPVLNLLPQRPPLDGSLSGALKLQGDKSGGTLEFAGAGQGFVISGVGIGGVPKLNLSASTNGGFMLQADEVAAAGIESLRGLYPNLRGFLSFRAHRADSGSLVGLSGQLTESNLPDISFRADWNDEELKLNSLKAALNPAVELAGVVKGGKVDMKGQLAGQSLRQLMQLGGSQAPQDIAANLSGSFHLKGPLRNPTATLVGPVSNMRYRNSALGGGDLNLTVNQRLAGELRLNKPYDATLADAAPGSVTQVPMINRVLKSALKARITAVEFGGTPSDPKVTPVVVGVGVADSVNLPTELKIPDVQTQLPGVLKQTGIKIPDLKIKKGKTRIKIPGTNQSIKIKL